MYKHWVLCANVYRLRSCVDKWYMSNVHKTYIVHIIHEHKTNTQRFLNQTILSNFCPSVIKNTYGLNLLWNLYWKGVKLSPFKWVIWQCYFCCDDFNKCWLNFYASPSFFVTIQNHSFLNKKGLKVRLNALGRFLDCIVYKWSSEHLVMFFPLCQN